MFITIFCLFVIHYSLSGNFYPDSRRKNDALSICKQVNDTIIVEHHDVKVGCLRGTRQCTKCIISNEKEYQALLDDPSPHPDCDSYKLPYMDFSKYILIGEEIIGVGGCKPPDWNKELIKIPTQKKYILKVHIKPNGGCEMLFHVRIWIMIPKIEPDYTIEFNTKYDPPSVLYQPHKQTK